MLLHFMYYITKIDPYIIVLKKVKKYNDDCNKLM
jgi:hypothetical protein